MLYVQDFSDSIQLILLVAIKNAGLLSKKILFFIYFIIGIDNLAIVEVYHLRSKNKELYREMNNMEATLLLDSMLTQCIAGIWQERLFLNRNEAKRNKNLVKRQVYCYKKKTWGLTW